MRLRAIACILALVAGGLFPALAGAGIVISGNRSTSTRLGYYPPPDGWQINGATDYLKYARFMRCARTQYANQESTWDADWKRAWKLANEWLEERRKLSDTEVIRLARYICKNCEDPDYRAVYASMDAAQEDFYFTKIEVAAAEVQLRVEAVRKLASLNTSGIICYRPSVNVSYSTKATKWDFWKHTNPKTAAKENTSLLREISATPSQAIEQLFDAASKPTYTECRPALYACIWWGQYNALKSPAEFGKPACVKFDEKYPAETGWLYVFPDFDPRSTSPEATRYKACWAKWFRAPRLNDDPVIGDNFYLKTADYDLIKKEYGGRPALQGQLLLWQGENYLVSGRAPLESDNKRLPLYVGLGAGPVTARQAQVIGAEAYNGAFASLFDQNPQLTYTKGEKKYPIKKIYPKDLNNQWRSIRIHN